MRRRALVALVAVALAVIAAWAFLAHREPVWSTRSAAALAAWQAGEEAMAKLYLGEAAEHYAEALEHDPGFAMPKLFFLRHPSMTPGGAERVKRIVDDLRGLDLTALNRRERLLVSYFLAHRDRDREGAAELLEAYLADHPQDPWAMQLRCDAYWAGDAWGEAAQCYRDLITLDPNRVEAQNRIGYAHMAEGNFAAAEAQFEIYRYLAPDQANPHDSLADLLTMTGRYDEAGEELRLALEVRSDFCPAWVGLMEIELLRHDYDAAAARLEEAGRRDGCPPRELTMLGCEVESHRHAAAGRWEDVWQTHAVEGCKGGPGLLPLLAALATGRTGEVDARVAEWRRELGDGAPTPPYMAHVLALRALLGDGDAATAVEWARRADDGLRYMDGTWHLKLWNRLVLAEMLGRSGRHWEAAELRDAVAEVNRDFAEAPPFRLPGG